MISSSHTVDIHPILEKSEYYVEQTTQQPNQNNPAQVKETIC